MTSIAFIAGILALNIAQPADTGALNRLEQVQPAPMTTDVYVAALSGSLEQPTVKPGSKPGGAPSQPQGGTHIVG